MRSTFTLVRLYNATGLSQPDAAPAVSPCTHADAPWNSDRWFGCEDTPARSKVSRTSMVVEGREDVGARASLRRFPRTSKGPKALGT